MKPCLEIGKSTGLLKPNPTFFLSLPSNLGIGHVYSDKFYHLDNTSFNNVQRQWAVIFRYSGDIVEN